MRLSIVTTLYKSSSYILKCISDFQQVLKELEIENYEFVFVNDGSPDDSLDVVLNIRKTNPNIKVVDLSRNFGHHYALQEGIAFAKGDLVYTVDIDLETPASFLKDCYLYYQKNNVELICGRQEKRKGHFIEKVGGGLFWRFFNRLSDTKVPYDTLTEMLMTRKFINNFLLLNDKNLFIDGMVHWVGFSSHTLEVKKTQKEGQSTYTFSKRFKLMEEAVTSFSGKPLELLFYFGLIVTFFSLLYLLFLLIQKIVMGDAIDMGWTSLVAISILSLGIISTSLGLIGIYIYRIYRQVQGRPNVIIKDIYQ